MIASLAAVGLGSFGGSSSSTLPPLVDESPAASATPAGLSFPDGPALTGDWTQPHKAIIKTNKGDIEIALATDAPQAVNSFAYLAGKSFYNGTFFFYVDHDFVAQAGDPTCRADAENVCSGAGGPGYTLPVEQTQEGHEQWAVVAPATAEGQSVHGSQFRILLQTDTRLDGKETVFGKVVKGQEILEGLPNFTPCSVAQTSGCVATPDPSAALVIEEVEILPA
ncbi:MAG: peptidylprolyl isomerase [Chloroflexi bacterium]|nr:peptidylprolyl isomerase [Chloroflexota bacterium]